MKGAAGKVSMEHRDDSSSVSGKKLPKIKTNKQNSLTRDGVYEGLIKKNVLSTLLLSSTQVLVLESQGRANH